MKVLPSALVILIDCACHLEPVHVRTTLAAVVDAIGGRGIPRPEMCIRPNLDHTGAISIASLRIKDRT